MYFSRYLNFLSSKPVSQFKMCIMHVHQVTILPTDTISNNLPTEQYLRDFPLSQTLLSDKHLPTNLYPRNFFWTHTFHLLKIYPLTYSLTYNHIWWGGAGDIMRRSWACRRNSMSCLTFRLGFCLPHFPSLKSLLLCAFARPLVRVHVRALCSCVRETATDTSHDVTIDGTVPEVRRMCTLPPLSPADGLAAVAPRFWTPASSSLHGSWANPCASFVPAFIQLLPFETIFSFHTQLLCTPLPFKNTPRLRTSSLWFKVVFITCD